MTYEELVQKVKDASAKLDANKITDHLAIQVNIEGEAEGAFYIEMLRGKVVVEPYEYYDRDVLLICQATQILDILGGKMDPIASLSDGQIRAEGNAGRLGLLGEIIKKTPAKKAPAKKTTTAKKAAPAKKAATTKKAAPAKKAEEAVKETVEEKAEQPAEEKTTTAKTTAAKATATKTAAAKTTAAKKTTTKAATTKKTTAKSK